MRLINLLTYIFANPNLILTKFHIINLLQLLFDFSWVYELARDIGNEYARNYGAFFEIIKSWLDYNLHGN